MIYETTIIVIAILMNCDKLSNEMILFKPFYSYDSETTHMLESWIPLLPPEGVDTE